VREVEVSIDYEMLHVGTMEILVYHTFVGVKFNTVLKFAGTVKIGGFDTFSRCKSRGVDTVLVKVSHENCPVEDSYNKFTNITLRDTASAIRNQWGDRIQHLEVLDLLRNC
jgi:hypothetical protein